MSKSEGSGAEASKDEKSQRFGRQANSHPDIEMSAAVAREHAEEAASMEAEGKLRAAKKKAETEDARSQAEKFEKAAREHGTD